MNKLFTKIVGVALGASMAVGVGVAVANNKEAVPAHAGSATYSEKAGTSLAAGDQVLIVASPSSGTTKYYVPVSTSYTGSAISNSSTVTSVNSIDDSHLWTVEKNNSSYAFKFTDSNKTYYLTVSGTGTGNKTRISTTTTYKNWNITSATNGYSMQNATTNNYFGVYTSGSDWRVYASATQANFGGTGVGIRFYTKDASKSLSSIALSGTYPTSFYTGDTFSHTGMTVTATYDDKTTADVTSSATFSGYNMSTVGNQTVTVSYTEGGTTKTATYGITVTAAPTAESAEVINDMATKTYVEGTAYDVTGLTLRITYDNDDTRDFDFAEDLTKNTDYILDHDNAVLGDTSLAITGEYLGCEFDFTVTGITVTPAPKVATYTIGGTNTSPTVTPSGLVPTGTTATWSNTYDGNLGQDTAGNHQILTISGFSKGTIITGIKLYMHSNKSAGSGYASYQVGSSSETALVGTIGSATNFNEWGDNTSYGTDWRDVTLGSSYSINVPASSTFKIKIACVTNNSLYCTGFTINYDYATPTFVASPTSHEIYCGEVAESTITVANFDSDPTLEYEITSGSSYISDVEIGSFSNHQATVLIEGHSTNHGTAVIRVRDAANKTTYYADITVVVNEIPAYEIELSISTDTGSEYGYVGDAVTVSVTTSRLQGTGITWSVTSGSVDSSTIVSDNTGYTAEANAAGTLTIKALDNGNSENYATASVTIVKALNPVMVSSETPHSSELTFTGKYSEGGEKVDGVASDIWTVTSDGTESTWDSANGIHFGTNSASVQYVQLATSDIATGTNDIIKSIVVNTQDRATSKGSLTVTVGGVNFKHEGNASVTVTGGPADYTFTGNGTGEIVVKVDRGSEAQKAIYVKSVTVNYVTTGTPSDIANAENMHLAQKAVIDYAKDFNDNLEAICIAYGSTNVSNLTNAWNNLADQYDNWFNNGDKDLTPSEIAHAKALFANADSVNREKVATADELQHMLAKYDEILSHYDLDDFLADDAGTSREPVQSASEVSLFKGIGNNTGVIVVVIVSSVVTLTAIGGYFFIRRRKKQY